MVLEDFNTSNVIFYQCRSSPSGGRKGISIHPMLFFIHGVATVIACITGISIHPMLFFIPDWNWFFRGMELFQYIQCYFLSYRQNYSLHSFSISIHPMLFFICNTVIPIYSCLQFQYIQCYFLSIKHLCRCKFHRHFNTSNVIFYHG